MEIDITIDKKTKKLSLESDRQAIAGIISFAMIGAAHQREVTPLTAANHQKNLDEYTALYEKLWTLK